jgi:hypothetical protein
LLRQSYPLSFNLPPASLRRACNPGSRKLSPSKFRKSAIFSENPWIGSFWPVDFCLPCQSVSQPSLLWSSKIRTARGLESIPLSPVPCLCITLRSFRTLNQSLRSAILRLRLTGKRPHSQPYVKMMTSE